MGACHQGINGREAPLDRRVISGPEVVEARLIIPFLLGEHSHTPSADCRQRRSPHTQLSYTHRVMPRKSTKPKPPQGTRLTELRKDGGLSQYELARYVGLPQANIAFLERSEKPPRSDVLPKMAQALGVTVEDLIVGDQKPLKKAAKHNGRPAGRCARFSIASPNYAASRSISSIGLRLRVALRAEQTELTLV